MGPLERIYDDRAAFYRCGADLFTTTGITFIAVESLTRALTVSRVGSHLLFRYDPNLDLPFESISDLNLEDINNVLQFVSARFEGRGMSWNEPYIYHYKIDTQLATPPTIDLTVKRIDEPSYPLMDAFLSECSEEDIDEADIDLDEPDPVIFCGFRGDTIVAYVSHRYFSNGIADIGILVHPHYRRRGYGLAMVHHDTLWCLENDKVPLYCVRRDNIGSMALVGQLGFSPIIEAYRFD